ncbi:MULTISPECIES: TRAP transporter fused permease subunit [Rhodomicrobium]|uniref:TRAP transporter permease n=1 Tax=Rhodomicrobium TaxID=1068 RepID=UPI000B4B2952|nr:MULTISPECIES: TRAP transporter fused permease subunit [Rhodomicrobium]
MAETTKATANPAGGAGIASAELDEAALAEAQKYIEEEEGRTNRLTGKLGLAITLFAAAVSLFHLYAAYAIVPAYILRPVHVGLVLFLVYLLFPVAERFRDRIRSWDFLLGLASLGVIGYILYQGPDFGDRAILPDRMDLVVGIAFIVLLLEATRRSTGIIMPIVALLFLAYAYYGPYLPQPWTHRGYGFERLTGHLYMTLEGIFGVAVDVSSSLIILFTIFGAFLQHSGAGKFFIDFSFAALGGKRSAAGRSVVLASFLMGGPSGSGVATTVAIGSVAYPMLKKAGFTQNAAGGLLAAGGLGAILSPPVLGAAAFLIAEFLKISYFDVILMATIPTILYYFGILVMVELEAAKSGSGGGAVFSTPKGTAGKLARTYWFHFLSLISIIVFMLMGFSAERAVLWATGLSFATSFLRSDTALVPPKLLKSLADGTIGVLTAAVTCASAGIIVGVVTLTGLGLKFSAIAIDYAGGSLLLTAIYTALIVWIVGLAVPVTASYIICAVIAAPALTKLGVPDYAAHMFIFYYAVLSEVSPPTALSPFAAAAITGGNPYITTLQSWKYTMPAFLMPFVFVLDPIGGGLLLKIPAGGSWLDIPAVTLLAAAGIAALAFAAQRQIFRRNNLIETVLLTFGGLLLIFPRLIDGITGSLLGGTLPYKPALGGAIVIAVIALQYVSAARQQAAPA